MAHALLSLLSDKQIGDKLNQESGGQRELMEYYGIPRPSTPSAEADAVHTLGYLYSPNWTALSTAGNGYIDLTFQVVKGQTTQSLTRAAAARVFPFAFSVLDADRYDATATVDVNYSLSVQTGTVLGGGNPTGYLIERPGFPFIRAQTNASGVAKIRITRTGVTSAVQASTAAAAYCLVVAQLDIAHAHAAMSNRMLLTDFDA